MLCQIINVSLEIYKAFQDGLTFLNRHNDSLDRLGFLDKSNLLKILDCWCIISVLCNVKILKRKALIKDYLLWGILVF